jgi:two-component system chemotaxis response regulator CheB
MTTDRRLRVLVVDDSAFTRKVLRESLTARGDIEVVGIARDGLDALEKIAHLAPDVITLDLVMPNLDGLGVLRALQSLASPPAVVVVSTEEEDGERGVAALVAGAFDLVHKPTALPLDQLYELGDELVRKVLAAGESGRRPLSAGPAVLAAKGFGNGVGTAMVVLGASTGGPHAIGALLRALPADFPAPVAIVVHLPPGYTEAFAKRLDGECALEVREAEHRMPLAAGRVIVARAGVHMRLHSWQDGFRVDLGQAPYDSLHRPSVDVLFESAAEQVGARTLGVVLTGMGNDGLLGSRAIHAAGGRILAEAASSCVVYGMPRCVFEDGIAYAEAPLDRMAELLIASL